nr:ATP-binding protein [Thiospirillum jenense]
MQTLITRMTPRRFRFNAIIHYSGYQFALLAISLTVLISLVSWVGYRWLYAKTLVQVEEVLNVISRIHVDQLTRWRNAHFQYANAVSQNPLLIRTIQAARRGEAQAEADLQQWLAGQRVAYQQRDTVFFDQQTQRCIQPASAMATCAELRAMQPLVWQAVIEQRQPQLAPVFYPPQLDNRHAAPTITLLIPVVDTQQTGGELLGLVVVRYDLRQNLYPLLQNWTLPRLHSVMLLVTQDGDTPRLANELPAIEIPPNPPLAKGGRGDLQIGMSLIGRPELGATMFMLRVTDLWGRKSVAVTQQLPESDWRIITLAPLDVLLAQTHHIGLMLLVVSLSIMLAAGVFISLYIWRRRGREYLRRYQYERQRRELAEAVRTRDEQLQHFYAILLNTSLDGFWLCDLNGRFLEVNAAYCAMIGYSRSELLQLRIADIEAVESEAEHAARLIRLQQMGNDRFESQHRCRDGSIIAVEISASYSPANGGQVYVFLRDMTQRKQMDQVLAIERAQLRSLFDGLDDIIYVADPHSYHLVYVNETVRRLFNPQPIGQLCYAVLYGRVEPCLNCTNAQIFNSDNDQSYVWERQNEFNQRWYRCADKVITWSDGRRLRFEIAADITAQKLHEQQRIQLEKLSALGQLTAGVAHELNNPLMGIINEIQFCLDVLPNGDECADSLRAAEHQTRRCMDIVQSLLTFSRPSAVTFQLVDPREVVGQTIRLLDYRLRKEGIKINLVVADDVTTWRLQPARFEQVLINLLANAIDAVSTCTDKQIALHLHQTTTHAQLTVSDNGCGITAADQLRLCEPFFTTKPTGQGTGLGLATSWSIIAEHGGTLEFRSQVGTGTTVTITLINWQPTTF